MGNFAVATRRGEKNFLAFCDGCASFRPNMVYPTRPASALTRSLRVATLAVGFAAAFARAAEPAAAPTPAPAAAEVKSSPVENAVVKIFATRRSPDPYKPWTKQAPGEGTGSGIILEGKRILTNAHVVLYSSQVQVQANQSGDKISATATAL